MLRKIAIALAILTELFAHQTQAQTPKYHYIQITSGGGHTCGITTNASVKCWGDNRFYQLGDGTALSKSYPVDVIGLTSGVIAISAGTMHTCALLKEGAVKCWGISGKLGDGTSNQRIGAVDVIGLNKNVISIAAGDTHTCAITQSGEVKCWGDNYNNKLGAGPDQAGLEPTTVLGINEKVTAITVGIFHSCALTSSNVYCWGDNYFGQLGDRTKINSDLPVAVIGLNRDIKAINAGSYHTCALAQNGQVQCWGYNKFGQLGDGSTIRRAGVVTVTGLPSNIDKVVSAQHSCALTTDGNVKCWGYNSNGQLGNNATKNLSSPIDVQNLPKINNIVAGRTNTCVITETGDVQCWGGRKALDQISDAELEITSKPIL